MQKILNNNFFIYILLFLFAYYISSGYLGDINILFSFDHYTVKEYFLIESKNYNFKNHFNYGVEAYGKSLISSYYKIFQVITFQKIDLLRLQQITIFFEIVLYFFSFYYLQNTIFKTSQKINAISSIIFTFSSILLYNFANFKLPHYFGIHYQFSMSFAMLAIASCIEEKKIQTSAFAFLSLGFHFIIGIYSFLFISIYLLISKKVRYLLIFVISNLVFLLPFLYFYNYFEMININNFKYNNIKIFFLKYYSNHHYPFKYQMFSYLINNYVISKISLILYLIIKIKQKVFSSNTENLIYVSISFFFISLFGLILVDKSNFEILKFRLHGIDLFFLLIAGLITLNTLISEVNKNHSIKSLLNLINLVLLGYFNFIFTVIELYQKNKNFKLIGTFLIIILLIFYYYNFITKEFILLSVVSILIYLFIEIKIPNYLAFLFVILFLPIYWIYYNYPNNVNLNKEIINNQKNILESAKWIEKNTNNDSIILVDKSINPKGGISPFSKRSEYGLPSMLLFDAVIYGNDANLIHKGIKRFCLLTSSNENCLDIIFGDLGIANFQNLEKEFFDNFYNINENKLKKAGIDYVITDKINSSLEPIFYSKNINIYEIK